MSVRNSRSAKRARKAARSRALLVLAGILFQLFRPYREATRLTVGKKLASAETKETTNV